MRTAPLLLLVLAVLLAGGAVAWFFTRGQDPGVEVEPLLRVERDFGAPEEIGLAPPPMSQKGGTFGGVVLESGSRVPIEGATVLLIRFETGEGMEIPQWKADGSDFDPSRIPRIGGHEIVGEARTDKQGRWSVTAGLKDVVRLVVAWDAWHAPRYHFTGKPEDEIVTLLDRGGTLKGSVVGPDGRPVRGAIVDVYLQSIARPAPQPSEDNPFPRVEGAIKPVPAAAVLGDLLGREIGPRVYGLDPGRTDALRYVTGVGGTFTVGPVDDSVQLWVVITHPDYMWSEFDEIEGVGIRRPVLHPGETLERTYALQTGNWIEGRVVSDEDENKGVEGVLIEVRHPVNYKRHVFYKTHMRRTVTREDGSFRLAGLSHGPFVADLRHPSFGSEFVGEIPANTTGLKWRVKGRGGIRGTVEGLAERPPGGRIEVLLEPVGERGAAATSRRVTAIVNEQGVFTLEQLAPGTYRVSVRAGSISSREVEALVEPHRVAEVQFRALLGGELEGRVVDAQGWPVDPASLTLLRLTEEGASTALGSFVSRGGELFERGVAPGRYRMEASAMGYLPAVSEPFDIVEGAKQVLAPLVLRKAATLRIGTVGPERGRAPGEVKLEVREGEGPWRQVLLTNGTISVMPGAVEIRAGDDLGRTFARTLDLAEGASVTVDVVLREP